METYILQVKREIPDSGSNQIVNMIKASVADHCILPHNEDNGTFHAIPLKIKTEQKEAFEMFPSSENIGPSAGDLSTLPGTKSEPLDLDSPSVTIAKQLEILEQKMIFEDHGTTYPKDSCDVQQNVSSSEHHGIKVEFPSSRCTMAGEINFIDQEGKIEKSAFLKDTNYLMSRTLKKGNLSSCCYDKQLGGCREIQHNNSKVKSAYSNQYCLHCDKIFSCLEDLRKHHLNHERVHIINRDCQLECITDKEINYSSRSSIKSEKSIMGFMKNVGATISGEKDYSCKLCEKDFDENLQLIEHIQKFHDRTIPCKKISYQKNVSNSSNQRDKPHSCDQCGKAFRRKYNLKLHILSHTGIKPFKCNQCGKSYLKEYYLKTHLQFHSGIKLHKCSVCEKAFLHVDYLKRHLMIHSGEKVHKCDQCEKAFRQKSELTKHILIHTGEKRYFCSPCGKTFRDKGHLNRHMMRHTGERPHKCSQCDKTYTSRYHLETHSICHAQENPHLCRQCGKTFASASNLKGHSLLHSKEKPHKCDQCGKAFFLVSQLTKHMFSHSNERSHSCGRCKKTFKLKSDLKSHMFSHSGEKPYSCNQCGKAFFRKHDLKIHVLIHTGEKNYLCPECGKLFRTRNNLNCHIKSHTEERTPNCP